MMEINKILQSIGCCKACILRYIGSKNPTFYADADNAFKKLDTDATDPTDAEEGQSSKGAESPGADGEPSSKRRKHNPCICCLGLLQKESWPDMLTTIKQIVEEKNYDSETFACALTSPMSLFLREHSINLFLQERLPKWKPDNLTSLKEAWKWSFGVKMAEAIGKTMNSGATCQYMIKANMTYAQDTQELESLQRMCPRVFEERSRAHRKFRGEVFTRKGVEGMLAEVDSEVFRLHFRCPPDIPPQGARCEGAECLHQPIYLAGRYSKFSRELCQTPWILDGKRMMESSIQDIIFKPVAELYNIPLEEVGNRLKFLSSGREDVDVRCLGLGRPFAVEISDPKGARLDAPSLAALTQTMCRDKALIQVRDLQIVSREELTILKMGEETKSKTYLALCVKIEDGETKNTHNSECVKNSGDSTATLENGTQKNGVESELLNRIMQADLDRLNTFSNDDNGFIKIQQKTPLRVLHRRPLLIRERRILKMEAEFVKDKPNLFIVEMTTEAGTYIKEFVHGDFGRTKPSLTDILGFKVDILALDVKSVNLNWPKTVELHDT